MSADELPGYLPNAISLFRTGGCHIWAHDELALSDAVKEWLQSIDAFIDSTTTIYVIKAHLFCVNIYNLAYSATDVLQKTLMSAVVAGRVFCVQLTKVPEASTKNIMLQTAHKNQGPSINTFPAPLHPDVIMFSYKHFFVNHHTARDIAHVCSKPRVEAMTDTLLRIIHPRKVIVLTFLSSLECTFYVQFLPPDNSLHSTQNILNFTMNETKKEIAGIFEMSRKNINTVFIQGLLFEMSIPPQRWSHQFKRAQTISEEVAERNATLLLKRPRE